MKVATLILALLALPAVGDETEPRVAYSPPASYWVLDGKGRGHCEWTAERWYLATWDTDDDGGRFIDSLIECSQEEAERAEMYPEYGG